MKGMNLIRIRRNMVVKLGEMIAPIKVHKDGLLTSFLDSVPQKKLIKRRPR